jgi:8-amino-7-oxononanoate synthase
MNARPITWPTVPKGKDRVRVCLHAGNKVEDIEMLVAGIVDWAEANLKKQGQERGQWVAVMVGLDGMLESKL